MYSRDQIDQVRNAVDIVSVIREYVPSLKVAGRSVKGLCPFHSERTPSFHVHPEKGIYKCFGCGEGGDAIGFLSKIEQMGFSEALEKLADQAGVRLERQQTQERREPEGIREKLHRVLAAAGRIYEDLLWDDKAGKAARDYLGKRVITDETAQFFHLGVAPSGGSGIFETLVKKGFPIEICQQAGLVSRSNSGRFYDPMFGRLIFPIFDSFGHVIGFGGRTLPNAKPTLLGASDENPMNEGPKYLNSPETPVFSKGKALYGIREAKAEILATHTAILFEGYMDVIGVYQGGVKNGVATLGTAFTRDHARMLKRYSVETAYAFFDPDEAGKRAALRSLEPILQEDIYPRIVSVEGNQDPDEIIAEQGKAHFDAIIKNAPDFVDSILKQAFAEGDMSLQKKADVGRNLMTLIAQSPNDILKSEWTRRAAEKLGLARESLVKELMKQLPLQEQTPRPAMAKRSMPTAEEEFLELLLSAPQLFSGLDISAEEFLEARHAKLFSLMSEQMKSTGRLTVPGLMEDMPIEHRDWMVQLTLEEKEFSEPVERCQQLARDIRTKRVREQLGRLQERVAQGQASADEQAEYKDLLKRVKGSK